MAFSTTAMTAYALAISVASTAATYVGQQQQASQQGKLNASYAMSESEALRQSAVGQYGQGQRQITYNDAQATQKTLAENMQASAAMATSQTNASARGVTGNSVDAIQRDYSNRAAMYDADVEFNRTASDDEIMQQLKGVQLGTQSQVNQVQNASRAPQGPSPFSLVAGLASDGISAYDRYKSHQPITPQAANALSIPTSADYAAIDRVEDGLY
jgi:hypothetical protein